MADWLFLASPWELSLTTMVVMTVIVALYLNGTRKCPPSASRQILFWSGLLLVYIMLHTQWDYYAQREFFMHRIQHAILHHLAPFLLVLAFPGSTLRQGMPFWFRLHVWRPFVMSWPVRLILAVLLQPAVAALMFFGIIFFWLWPPVHFIAMLDWRWYRIMNWSVTVDGFLFWWLILDHRAHPPAHLSYPVRIFMALVVALPQVLLGAWISFSSEDLYPIYELCGRALTGVSTLQSQYIGGLVLWLPSAMMSVIGAIIAFHYGTVRKRRRSHA